MGILGDDWAERDAWGEGAGGGAGFMGMKVRPGRLSGSCMSVVSRCLNYSIIAMAYRLWSGYVHRRVR